MNEGIFQGMGKKLKIEFVKSNSEIRTNGVQAI